MPIFPRLTRITVLAAALSGGSTILTGLAGAQPAEEREAPAGKSRERPRPATSEAPTVELAGDARVFPAAMPDLFRLPAGGPPHSTVTRSYVHVA